MKQIDKSSNQSTQVAFLLMEALAEIGRPVALSDLARMVNLPKPRVFRYLRTLLSMGYVLQDAETERYRLSLKVFHLGQAVADSTALLNEARPVMVQIRDRTGQTVTLSLIDSQGMRVIDMVRAETPVQIVTKPGSVLDFHSSAQGKIALAFGPPGLWGTVRANPRKRWTDLTNTDLAVLEAEVADVARLGWAEAPQQTLIGINAVSAPVFDMSNTLAATVTIAGPMAALPSPPPGRIVSVLTSAAKTISENLGCMEYPTCQVTP